MDIAVLEVVVEAVMVYDIVLDNLPVVVPGMPEHYGVANVNIGMELASDAGPVYIRRWIVWDVIAFLNYPVTDSQQYKLLAGALDT